MKLIRTKEDFVIARLEELIDDRESFIISDPEHDEIYEKDINALKAAIEFLKNAALVKHGEWTEKKHSCMKWIPDESDDVTEDEVEIEDMVEQKCSVCQRWAMKFVHHIEMNFCPHCGARMDGDKT